MSKCFAEGVCIHGAFKKKSAANAKAKQRNGKVIFTSVRGDLRYVVISGKRKK